MYTRIYSRCGWTMTNTWRCLVTVGLKASSHENALFIYCFSDVDLQKLWGLSLDLLEIIMALLLWMSEESLDLFIFVFTL